jgi:hypothetical protein
MEQTAALLEAGVSVSTATSAGEGEEGGSTPQAEEVVTVDMVAKWRGTHIELKGVPLHVTVGHVKVRRMPESNRMIGALESDDDVDDDHYHHGGGGRKGGGGGRRRGNDPS